MLLLLLLRSSLVLHLVQDQKTRSNGENSFSCNTSMILFFFLSF